MKYVNLKLLCDALPALGYGEAIVFNNTPHILEKIHTIIRGIACVEIIFQRSDHLSTCDSPTDFGVWLNEIKQTETYEGYLLQNYKYEFGDFVIKNDIDTLEFLAGKVAYYNVNKMK